MKKTAFWVKIIVWNKQFSPSQKLEFSFFFSRGIGLRLSVVVSAMLTNVHQHINTPTHQHINTNGSNASTHTQSYTHTYTHTHIHTYTHTHIHTNTQTHDCVKKKILFGRENGFQKKKYCSVEKRIPRRVGYLFELLETHQTKKTRFSGLGFCEF